MAGLVCYIMQTIMMMNDAIVQKPGWLRHKQQ